MFNPSRHYIKPFVPLLTPGKKESEETCAAGFILLCRSKRKMQGKPRSIHRENNALHATRFWKCSWWTKSGVAAEKSSQCPFGWKWTSAGSLEVFTCLRKERNGTFAWNQAIFFHRLSIPREWGHIAHLRAKAFRDTLFCSTVCKEQSLTRCHPCYRFEGTRCTRKCFDLHNQARVVKWWEQTELNPSLLKVVLQ